MKKTIRAISLVLALSAMLGAMLCFAGCGDEQNSPAPSTSPGYQSGKQDTDDYSSKHENPTDDFGNQIKKDVPKDWGIESADVLVSIVYDGKTYDMTASDLFEIEHTEVGAKFSSESRNIGNFVGVGMKDLLYTIGANLDTAKINDIILYHADGSEESLGSNISEISPFECVISPYKNLTPIAPGDGVFFVAVYSDKSAGIKEFSGITRIEIR